VAPSFAVKVQAPNALVVRLAWSIFDDTAQPTRPACCGPSSVSMNRGPARVPATKSCFSPARTMLPLASTTAKALKVWTSSCATAGLAAAMTRAPARARLNVVMVRLT
jgi:hypothetical protein